MTEEVTDAAFTAGYNAGYDDGYGDGGAPGVHAATGVKRARTKYLAMRAASNSPTTNGEVSEPPLKREGFPHAGSGHAPASGSRDGSETLRTAIIQTLMACTDKMGFDLAGNDFAYVANELLNGPIANLTPRALHRMMRRGGCESYCKLHETTLPMPP